MNSIPSEILNKAFPNTTQYNTVIPVETQINNKVIQSRVLPDCNILGGKMKTIPLLDDYYEPVGTLVGNPGTTQSGIYRIPPHERDSVDIVEVISVVYRNTPVQTSGYGQQYGHQGSGGTNVMVLANEVMDSHTMGNVPNMPLPECISGNLIRLDSGYRPGANLAVNCRLAYDSGLINLPKSAYMPFSRLVTWAVKAYIHNFLVVKLNTMEVTRGHEVGVVKDIIDDYKDANEQYEETLLNFRSGSMLDHKQKMFLISHML